MSLNLVSRFTRYSPSIARNRVLPIYQGRLSNRATIRLPVHDQINLPRSSSRSMTTNSAQLNVHDHHQDLSVEKWGWVIYRCDYGDDEAWARFRAHVEAISRESIAESDAPEIADCLQWTWVEDAASLDGISTGALRMRFRAWVADEEARQPSKFRSFITPRYRFFFKIDQEVLQSLAKLDTAFVKLVDGTWEPNPPSATAEETEGGENDFWPEEPLEPIDGCTEEDVGWMRIAPYLINAEFYEALNGDEHEWRLYYQRPPSIVLH